MNTLTLNEMERQMKRLCYAYATSTSAERYNGGKGCWLFFIDDCEPEVFQDDQRWEALARFESVDVAYSKFDSFDRNSTPFLSR